MSKQIITISLIFFLCCSIIDFATPQSLVAAILMNIPIALSGLSFSKRFTIGLLLASLLSNLLAGVFNSLWANNLDFIAIFNRILAAFSFLLVGILTIRLSEVSQRVGVLRSKEAEARLERDFNYILTEITATKSLAEALERACKVITSIFKAKGVLIATSDGQNLIDQISFPKNFTIPTKLPSQLLGEPPKNPVSLSETGKKLLNLPETIVIGFDNRLVFIIQPRQNENEYLGKLANILAQAFERVNLIENLQNQSDELKRRADLIRDLVYAFSHDLRTPLLANVLSMKLALDGVYGEINNEYKNALRNGIISNEDLLALADSLLQVARLENGEIDTFTTEIDLLNLVTTVVNRLNSTRIKLIGQSSIVRAKSDELRRVLQNLLDNALKFSQDLVEIEVVFGRVEVRDRGPGVSSEIESRLFSRFAWGKVGGGSGLGLYLAKRIIENSGGKIGYQPRAGGGSIFWFELPKI